MRKIRGGCFCGQVQYELKKAPMFIQCCHCTECQNQTGAPFVVNGLIETAFIHLIKGKLERVAMSKGKESPHDIYRCRKCKVAVWSDYGRRPWVRFLRIMTLDNPRRFKPRAHIFTSTKWPHVQIPKGVPTFREYYDIQKVWPKESLRRRQKASL
jgi:hypothetical protein